jgi:hypothetical protein
MAIPAAGNALAQRREIGAALGLKKARHRRIAPRHKVAGCFEDCLGGEGPTKQEQAALILQLKKMCGSLEKRHS